MTKRVATNMTPLADDPSQPSYVRELLEAGRSARVSGYDFDKGLALHAGRVSAGTPAPDWAKTLQSGGAGAAASTTAGPGIVGWLAVPVAAAAVAAAVMLVWSQQATPVATEARPPIAKTFPSPVVVPEQAARAPQAVVAEPVATALPAPIAQGRPVAAKRSAAGPSRGAAAKSLVRGDATPRAGGPAWTEHGVKSATSEASAEPLAAAPLGPAAQPVPAASEQPAAQERIAREAAATPVDDARLEREMGMLAMAQRVLRTDPDRALKLARQGEAEFHGSMFTQERQQLLLLSLIELGRMDEARQLARPYLARFPNGPFSDRVRRALASGKVER